MKRILFVFIVAMSIQLVRGAETPALIERPGSANGPSQVSVGIWIVDISNIDSAQQNVTADIAMVLRWKDGRLAHTGTGAVHYALDQIWTPRVGIANETSSVVRKFPESADAEPDGTVLYRQLTSDRLRNLCVYTRLMNVNRFQNRSTIPNGYAQETKTLFHEHGKRAHIFRSTFHFYEENNDYESAGAHS